GNALSRIEQIRKRIAGAARFFRHALRPILRIGVRIVGADRDDGDTLLLVVTRETRELVAHVFYIRAVTADECNHQPARSGEVFECADLTVEIGEAES